MPYWTVDEICADFDEAEKTNESEVESEVSC